MADATETAPATPPETATGSVVADALKAAGARAPIPPAAAPPAETTAPAATPSVADGEITLTPPKDSGLTEDHAKQVAEFAKANKLTQAQAEKILERDAQGLAAKTAADQAAAKKAEADQLAQLQQVQVDSKAAWSKDPDFGGAKLQESNIDVGRVLSQEADPELVRWLSEHPLGKALGSDPLFLRMLARIGQKHYREDGGNGPANPPSKSSGKSWVDETAELFANAGKA